MSKFVEPLDSSGTKEKAVMLFDGCDVWWIDDEGELLYWDNDKPPSYAHEVRRADQSIEKLTDDEVQRLFETAPVITDFSWVELFKEWGI